jgi:hypothetical protein
MALPNVFDVNDDGDAVLDQADANNPAPSAGANCQAGASFNVFTNFKSTQTNYARKHQCIWNWRFNC